MKTLLTPLLSCLILTGPALAEEQEPTKDFSLQVGGGMSFLPGLEWTQVTRLGYRLPLLDKNIEAIVDVTSSPLFLWGIDQVTLAGQYHFSPHDNVRPFASLGVSYLPLRRGLWGVQFGGGADFMWTQNFGWSPQLRVQLPVTDPNLAIINVDVAYKWQF